MKATITKILLIGLLVTAVFAVRVNFAEAALGQLQTICLEDDPQPEPTPQDESVCAVICISDDEPDDGSGGE
jgi:hypothetical protein